MKKCSLKDQKSKQRLKNQVRRKGLLCNQDDPKEINIWVRVAEAAMKPGPDDGLD
jgi:hypothetical protein